VTRPDDSHDPDIEAISSELSEGLESCRSMLNDYRATLRRNLRGGSDAELDVRAADKSRGNRA
jgi:hypothetical protein